MFEVIKDVLEAEKKAARILEDARQQAARLRSEFSEEESKELTEAQNRSDHLLRRELASIRETEDQRVAGAQERIRREVSEFDPRGVPGMEGAIDAAAELVIAANLADDAEAGSEAEGGK